MKPRKSFSRVLPLLCLAISGGNRLYADVKVANIGPEGGAIASLAGDPQNPHTVYAGSHHAGLFKTTDGGSTWSYAGLGGLTVNALAIDPQHPAIIYAATYSEDDEGDASNSAILKSVDGGQSWVTSSTAGGDCTFAGLTIDTKSTETLYAWVPCNGLFRSTDAGGNWVAINSGLPNLQLGTSVSGVAIHPQDSSNIYTVAVRCDVTGKLPPPSCESHVFRSSDRGNNWNEITVAAIVGVAGPLAIDPQNPNVLYARFMWPYLQNGVAKSSDGGRTWTTPTTGLVGGCCFQGVAVDPQDPATVYAYGFGVFKSTDGGNTWKTIYGPPFGFASLLIDGQNSSTIYGADVGGVFKSTDGGASWIISKSGLHATGVSALAIDPQTPGVLYTSVGGISKTTDGGTTWAAINSGLPQNYAASAIMIDPANPGTINTASEYQGAFKSSDGGINWSAAMSGLGSMQVNLLAIDPVDPSTVYAGTWGSGLLKSTDAAASWSAVNTGLPARGNLEPLIEALAIDPQNPDTIYIGTLYPSGTTYLPGLFKSSDRAMTWNFVSSFPPTAQCCFSFTVSGLVVDPRNSDTIYAGISGGAAGLWKTIDGGASWQNVYSSSLTAVALDPQDPARIFLSTGAGVLMTSDGGGNWTLIPGSPASNTLLAVDPKQPNVIYAGGPGGLFSIQLPEEP